jgi:hypothetical protein
VSRLDAAGHPGSLRDVTNVNEPSGDDGLPPAWLIVAGIIGALALVFLAGAGFGQEWGAEQWGPVAAWLSGAATLAAVVVALRQANIALRQSRDAQREARRGQIDRLVDHEVSRRRECIKAHSDLWAAVTGFAIEFRSFTDYLDNLPPTFNASLPRSGAPAEHQGEPFADEIGRRFETFYDRWLGVIQPPLFVCLAMLHATELYDAAKWINDAIAKMSNEDTEGGFVGIRKAMLPDAQHGIAHRPDTGPLTVMWHDILGRRNEHLRLLQQHFSLRREDVEAYVRQHWPL